MKSRFLLIALGLVSVFLVGVFVYSVQGRSYGARVELQVERLTCGACAAKIREALEPVPGFGAVEVDVAAGRLTVDYDPRQVQPEALAERVSAAGYPARVARALTGAEAAAGEEEAARLGEGYVGRIGEDLVSRDEFTAEVDRLRGTVPAGVRVPVAELQRAAWQQLVQRRQPAGGAGLPVRIFDPYLRGAVQKKGGCGGSCCG